MTSYNFILKPNYYALLSNHLVTKDGVKTDPHKCKAVHDWPEPRNQSELRAFLGLTNYYRRFVKGYAKITLPLTELLKKDFRFLWTSKAQASFESLKEALTSAPVLKIPNTQETFRLEVDASDHAVGAVLSQQEGDVWKPVAFESRKLKAAEKNYPIHERELLALIHALKVWRHYLYGQE